MGAVSASMQAAAAIATNHGCERCELAVSDAASRHHRAGQPVNVGRGCQVLPRGLLAQLAGSSHSSRGARALCELPPPSPPFPFPSPCPSPVPPACCSPLSCAHVRGGRCASAPARALLR